MRRLVTILLASVVLPAIGDTPPSMELLRPGNEAFSLDVLPPSRAFQQLQAVPRVAMPGVAMRSQSPKCYYIRQVNSNLQKPRDKPELVPLADKAADNTAAPVASTKPDCLADSILRRVGAR